MDLNSIQLPGFAVAGLYGNVLVDLNEATPPAENEIIVETGYRFLGGNKRHISLVADAPGLMFLSDEHLTFLTKILGACQVTMDDVAVVNNATRVIVISELKQVTSPSKVVLFGLSPTTIGLPVNFPQFKLQAYDGCTYLSVPPLDALDRNDAEGKLLKSKLWVCLRQLFETPM